jgi:hypothetical protein
MKPTQAKVQIERGWREWCEILSESHSLEHIARVRQEISSEVQWYLFQSDSREAVARRLQKYKDIEAGRVIPISSFDPIWRYRVLFFEWVLSVIDLSAET